MPTSNASSEVQSKLLLVVAALAIPTAFVAVAALLVLRTASGDGEGLRSVAETAPLRSPVTDSGAVGEPTADGGRELVEGDAGVDEPGESTTNTDPRRVPLGDPLLAAYGELWDIGGQFIGGNDPVGVIAALTDQVGAFPVIDDAALASFGLEVDREERDRAVSIKYRTSIRYYSQRSVDEIVEFYRAETPSLDLPERESKTGSDADGDFVGIEFGSFSDHPDPLIWWANLSLEVRADDAGALVRIYYTVTRTEAAVPSGLLADFEAGLPLAEGYENTSVRVSGFSSDPYVRPARFSVDVTATATRAAATADEAAELARLADLAAATGNWRVDEQTDAGVWLDHAVDDDLRNYLTLYLTESESVARYAYS